MKTWWLKHKYNSIRNNLNYIVQPVFLHYVYGTILANDPCSLFPRQNQPGTIRFSCVHACCAECCRSWTRCPKLWLLGSGHYIQNVNLNFTRFVLLLYSCKWMFYLGTVNLKTFEMLKARNIAILNIYSTLPSSVIPRILMYRGPRYITWLCCVMYRGPFG